MARGLHGTEAYSSVALAFVPHLQCLARLLLCQVLSLHQLLQHLRAPCMTIHNSALRKQKKAYAAGWVEGGGGGSGGGGV